MIYYAVIDTNVVISAMLKNGSMPYKILEYAFEGKMRILLNEEILTEYAEVLMRKKFGFATDKVNELIEEIKRIALFIDKTEELEDVPDPDDTVFYEVVMEARKQTDAYLVTGNIKHFPKKAFVVTPKEMLDIIEKK